MTTSPNRSRKMTSERNPYSLSTQEAMLIQDGYCSPDRPSYKDSSKQTPKSILKEYTMTNSASKSKKGIVINETLNETRKLSLRSETSEASGNKNRKRPQSAADTSLSSFDAQVRGSSHKNNEYDQQQSDQKRGFGSLWTSQAFNTGIRSDSTQGLSDFQKAYVKKLQRDREQEIYCEVVRKSNASLDQGNRRQKQEEPRQNDAYQDNRQLLKSFEQKRQSVDQGNSKRSQESLSSLGYVEDKIQELEKCLDVYSNRLRDSIIRQRDQLIAGNYRRTGHSQDNTPLRSWDEKDRSLRNKERNYETTSELSAHKKTKNSSVNQETYGHTQSNGRWGELDDGLHQLKEESKNLRSKLASQTVDDFNSTNKRGEGHKITNIFQKEVELLKTVEEIRTKLYNSIAQKSLEERNNERANTLSKSDYKKTREKETKKNNVSKKSNNDPVSKNQKVRKAYGEAVLERENACILNQGLSTSYSGFHWNADNSLQITRNI